ncbi:hypothetical protein SAMN04489793_1715 [Tsukamurella tyrosinosolvens]|uniref:DNA-binding transcriptional regulator of glucitol operon n=1 Tax=Tsukamurella tyrosinosolvens TaxID=57704 RepID=A0A1H4QD60_TSUTY|nr:hypothetical protein SAMN04489793_1715 [Tsukamurella tyrosinosolvens]
MRQRRIPLRCRSRYRHSDTGGLTGTVEVVNRRRHRPALIAFVVVAAAAFLALGWWQWGRFESTAGSARNLGYALQWPLFAVAAVWGYRRFVQLEDEAELQDRLAAGGETDTEPEAPASVARTVAAPRPAAASAAALTAIPEGFLPSRATAPSAPDAAPDDPAHDEYNRLLAELAGSEQTEEKK